MLAEITPLKVKQLVANTEKSLNKYIKDEYKNFKFKSNYSFSSSKK